MIENHVHTHVDENGKPHTHTHQHPHEQTKAVLNRISRAQGHLEAVRRMVERGEDCAQVLVQLSAVISALNSTGRVILKDHGGGRRHGAHRSAEPGHRPIHAIKLTRDFPCQS